MITDAEGQPVQLVHCVRYTNVITVKYEDGTTKDIPVMSLKSNDPKALVKEIQKVRPKAK